MFIRYGIRHYGSVKQYKGQDIQTAFFHICYIPLAPAEEHSIYVTEPGLKIHKGISIKLNKTSLIAAYARNGSIVLAVACFLLGMFTETVEWMGVALAFVVATIYLMGFYGRSSAKEKVEREVIGNVTGVYAKAAWLPGQTCHSFYTKLLTEYAKEGRNWKDDLRNGAVTDPKLIYAIALLNCEGTPVEENFELKAMAKELFEARAYPV